MALCWWARCASPPPGFGACPRYFGPPGEAGLPRVAIITALVVVLTVINIIGVKQSARVGDIFTVSKLIPLVLFVAVGLFFISPARFTLAARPALGSFSAALFILIYVFSAFESLLVTSREIRQPQRCIPFALVVA